MALTPRPSHYPNSHDLTSGNPAMRYFGAALAEIAPEHANLLDVLNAAHPGYQTVVAYMGHGPSSWSVGNTGIQPVGKIPLLDAVMARARQMLAEQ